MSAPGASVEGLVLCRVGDFQLAFPASGVQRISDWAIGDAPAPQARSAFQLPPAAGRLVRDAAGSVVVDSLEVASESRPLLGVPTLLAGAMGGALFGFIELSSGLCPVLSLDGFARYLEDGAKA